MYAVSRIYAVRRYLILLIYELKRGHITENVSTSNVHHIFVSGSFTLSITFVNSSSGS